MSDLQIARKKDKQGKGSGGSRRSHMPRYHPTAHKRRYTHHPFASLSIKPSDPPNSNFHHTQLNALSLFISLSHRALFRRRKQKKEKRKMGLQSQLNDVSSDSIPLLLLALLATFYAHLRSSLFSLLRSLGLSHGPSSPDDDDDARRLSAPLGSGLAGLIVLAEQRNLNRLLSDWFSGDGGTDCCCMVCLCGLRDGERVRKLPCRHVFHKRCLDGWLDQLKFDCPVCRSKLVSDERVELTAGRVGGELVAFFSPR